jgi:hypothetical protein
MVIFLSLDLTSQNKERDIKSLSVENQNYKSINTENTIKVISILNTDNLAEWEKLDRLAAKYKNKKISFIVVTDHSKTPVKNKFLKYQYLLKSDNKEIFNTYQTGIYKIFPIYIVLDKEGKIIYKKKGITNNIEGKISKRIDKLIEMYARKDEPQKLRYSFR